MKTDSGTLKLGNRSFNLSVYGIDYDIPPRGVPDDGITRFKKIEFRTDSLADAEYLDGLFKGKPPDVSFEFILIQRGVETRIKGKGEMFVYGQNSGHYEFSLLKDVEIICEKPKSKKTKGEFESGVITVTRINDDEYRFWDGARWDVPQTISWKDLVEISKQVLAHEMVRK